MSNALKMAALVITLLLVPAAALARSYSLGPLRIDAPWSRPNPPGAPTAVGYLTITNTGSLPDRLLGGDSPVVSKVEVHQMSMDGGIMRMRPVEGGLVIPPGQTVKLAPGGYHLMLIGPQRAFAVGDHIPVRLHFERAGDVKIELAVQTSPPGSSMSGMSMPGMVMH